MCWNRLVTTKSLSMNVTGECSPSLLANLQPSSVFLASCGQQSMYFNRFSTNLFVFFLVKMSAEANCRRQPMRLCSPMCRDLPLCRKGSSPPPPRHFQVWIKFHYKSGILLTKIYCCQWKQQFPSIVECSSVQLELWKGSFKISAYFSTK